MQLTRHIEAESFNRRGLVSSLAAHLGVRANYNGMPTCSYTVGDFTIDRQGAIIGENFDSIRSFLIEEGYAQESDFSPSTTEMAQANDFEAAANYLDRVDISQPVPDVTVLGLKNLVFMLYTKQYLLNRSFGAELLTISEQVISQIQNEPPETLSEFEAILQDAWSTDLLDGFQFKNGAVMLAFPHDAHDTEKCQVYSKLLERIVKCAFVTKRTKPVLQKPENERYYMHSWLIRLGCGGSEYKELRKVMLNGLDGYCAFPDEARAQKHREKYKEIRRIQREVNEEADRR